MNNKLQLVLKDLQQGLASWRIWLLFGWQDIRLRYRRSTLGPLWITLSMMITIYSMGFLYGHLFHMELKNYFPYLATGLLTWNLISTLIIESNNVFVEAGHYLKQIKLPYSIFVLRIITRNFIIFAHNTLAVIPILIFFHVPFGLATFSVLFSLLLLAINAFNYGLVLGILGARFRDITQIIVNLVQVIFFLTPILWMPGILPQRYHFFAGLNPFAHFISLIRSPLMGAFPSLTTMIAVSVVTLIGLTIMLMLMYRSRHRIVFWL